MFQLKVTDDLWNMLLDLKNQVGTCSKKISFIYFDENTFTFNEPTNKTSPLAVLHVNQTIAWQNTSKFQIALHKNLTLTYDLDSDLVQLLKLYGPLCLAKVIDKELPLVYIHIAQTLDGKIATENGHSKWIGNHGNICHAHRIRALSDSILIGANTLKNDCPKLTVRHVKGEDPRKIVISNSYDDFSSLTASCKKGIIVFRAKECESRTQRCENVDFRFIPTTNGFIHPRDILLALKKEGINIVFIEGGSFTISQFIQHQMVDFLQIHFAPMIFGSGRNAFILNSIDTVDEGIKLTAPFYTMVEDSVMLTGRLS